MRTLLAMCLVAAVAAGAGAAAKAEKTEKTAGKTEKIDLTKISYQVTGMSCGSCEAKLSEKFTSLDGVNVDKVCAKSGHAALSYDPAKIKPEAIATAIKATGFKVAAQTTSFKVAGMTCSGCESKLSKKFASIKGVTVDKVCAKSGHASVTYDPAKVKQADLAKAITDSGFEIK